MHDYKYERAKVVAEMCCNHMGNFAIAKKMIDAAAVSGATYAKFQKWCPTEALSAEQYNAPHPNPKHSYGEPYGKHRENLEFDISLHKELKEYSQEKGIKYCCSVFDPVSAKEVLGLNPEYIKVPSQKNLDLRIVDILCKEYGGEIHISTGMTTDSQVDSLLNYISKTISLNRVILYCTTSSYPCAYSDLNLLRLVRFKEKYGCSLKSVGFSGHHNGISADLAAYTLGATHIERHFTLNRSWKGTDHAASLGVPGLFKLTRDLDAVYSSLRTRPDAILDVEFEAYNKVKRSDAEAFENERK